MVLIQLQNCTTNCKKRENLHKRLQKKECVKRLVLKHIYYAVIYNFFD